MRPSILLLCVCMLTSITAWSSQSEEKPLDKCHPSGHVDNWSWRADGYNFQLQSDVTVDPANTLRFTVNGQPEMQMFYTGEEASLSVSNMPAKFETGDLRFEFAPNLDQKQIVLIYGLASEARPTGRKTLLVTFGQRIFVNGEPVHETSTNDLYFTGLGTYSITGKPVEDSTIVHFAEPQHLDHLFSNSTGSIDIDVFDTNGILVAKGATLLRLHGTLKGYRQAREAALNARLGVREKNRRYECGFSL